MVSPTWLTLLSQLADYARYPQDAAVVNDSVISVFGSSVANGQYCSGNCSGMARGKGTPMGGCYQSRLRDHQSRYFGRSVFNNCHGGDDTSKLLNRFEQMLSTKAGFVFLGLSMANEGLPHTTQYDRVFAHYEAGLRQLITKIRASGAEVVVGSNYPNSAYNEEQYAHIKRMNLLTQTWDLQIAQVNFLGTLDDGHGRWPQGFYANGGHPNDLGSTEMYYAIVPSIFDAIKSGKPAVPRRANGNQFVVLQPNTDMEVVEFTPAIHDIMHSFTFSFRIRCKGCTGRIATLDANEVVHRCPARWCKDHNYSADECGCGVCGSFGKCMWSCDPSHSVAGRRLRACPANIVAISRILALDVQHGRLQYLRSALEVDAMPGPTLNDGFWHTVSISHVWGSASTVVLIDELIIARYEERLNPTRFQLRPHSASVSYQDLLIYRSGLNIDEHNFLRNNKTHVLQASLEIYAPLDSNEPKDNRAQSLSALHVGKAQPDAREVVV